MRGGRESLEGSFCVVEQLKSNGSCLQDEYKDNKNDEKNIAFMAKATISAPAVAYQTTIDGPNNNKSNGSSPIQSVPESDKVGWMAPGQTSLLSINLHLKRIYSGVRGSVAYS